MVIIFAIIVAALVLFATEPIPIDITAIGVMVTLMLLEPWTTISPAEGVSGFANTATITVLAMFILSDGVRRTGIIQLLGRRITTVTGTNERKQLGATIGVVGPISGFINNTAAVAILLPMVTDIANEGKTSPSKLLIPLSYASMFGGTLTLIGTSTNILASNIAARLSTQYPRLHAFSMFEFTQLGVVVFALGTVYLLTVGPRLIPARIKPQKDLTEEFQMAMYLTEVVVQEDSPIVGQTVEEAIEESDFDMDVLQLIRDDQIFLEPLARKTIYPGDVFAIRTSRRTLVQLMGTDGFNLLPEVQVTEETLEAANSGQNLVEVVISPGSSLVGETLKSVSFRERYNTTVLALRRGPEVIHERFERLDLQVGDTLLIQGTTNSISRLAANPDLIVAQEVEQTEFRESKIPLAIGIVVGVVSIAALDILPIMVSALTGALTMAVTGVLKPTEVYDAVQWDVIFLLAGVIPLGIAMEKTGTATLLADFVVGSADIFPPLVVLGIFYLITALLTNVISNNASVVLMIPVAAEAAVRINASTYAFVLAVTFAASTAFMTPIGYQTNLFVYGPGGYKFSDYLRVGAPLQLLFAVVTPLGIAVFWGI
ncbi:SLC13 family permease [Haladaptatus pallidirubidus]|uniref:SLC13 family permease n=1 Tax=Haladaptatus pallidirubidus TaxID=1008152 RepID=A0AAV3UHT3_9EURY|nr:SLC13 family permease [Haladaptatus pallidirubidus]